MSQCPNCNYKLVFLEKRLRYKCAKCSRVFLQKFIENNDFQNWNKHRRELDKHNLNLEIKQRKRPRLSPEERKLRAKESAKNWRINNIEKCRKYSRKHYEENKDKILSQKKIYRQKTKEKQYKWRKQYRDKLIQRTRLLGRIHHWRRQQAKLTQQELKINGYKHYTNGLDDSFSTFGLSDQLWHFFIKFLNRIML